MASLFELEKATPGLVTSSLSIGRKKRGHRRDGREGKLALNVERSTLSEGAAEEPSSCCCRVRTILFFRGSPHALLNIRLVQVKGRFMRSKKFDDGLSA